MVGQNGSRDGSPNGQARSSTGATAGRQGGVEARLLNSLEWRCIGPHRGGRVVAVAGDPVNPSVAYFGACAGGVWKTTDGGTYWENVSDGYFGTAAVGAIAVSASDANVLYVGTGETAIRGNVSHGDGVYRSTDAGATWRNVGLAATRHIARVRIHPTDPDTVYVAALGDAWGPNPERGVYRSTNGGETWERVLYRDERSGAIDLAMDPNNPRVLYAALWQAQRGPHFLTSGGDGSGIFKSSDGGDTWTELTRHPGLPTGTIGKIGIAAAPKPGRVYAIVEAEDGAVFRSDDGGATWQRMSEEGDLRRRAWYYQHVVADPTDADTVWVLNVKCWRSIDAGKTFQEVPVQHGDNHDLWIDPHNGQRLVHGDDGGCALSYNGGASWSTILNQPTAQFYHVIADNQEPYRVYGSQQDNSAITLPSFSSTGAITKADWFVPGGGESGYIAIRPDNPNVVFAGAIGSGPGHGRLLRYDHASRQIRNITVWPEIMGLGHAAKDLKYRFQWTYPIELSPHDPSVLYVAAQQVLRSTDEGMSWTEISPDLTRNDASRLEASGGPITRDNTGAETYCTIFACLESRHERGTFWAGTDDGLVHVSRDDGQTWANVTPPDLPEWALISIIEQSPHDPATVYVAATRYKLQDRTPYLYKTNDYGLTWARITDGIPADDFTRTIREDPGRRGLLYAGTETGVYVSFDDGGHWQPLQCNLPVVPIHDLHVKGTDLLAATHGRSFWILDDLSPLHQLAAEDAAAAVKLARPRPATRWKITRGYGSKQGSGKLFRGAGALVTTFYATPKPTGELVEQYLDAGKNPPEGAVIHYYLRERPTEPIRLRITDAAGREVRAFSSAEGDLKLAAEPGANRFVWDLRHAPARKATGDETLNDLLVGPVVAPGTYTIELAAGGERLTQPLTVVPDPRAGVDQADYEAQATLLLRIRDRVSATHDAINALRATRAAVDAAGQRAKAAGHDDLAESAAALSGKLSSIEAELIQAQAASPLAYPTRLNGKLATLSAFVASADGRPTQQCYDVFDDLTRRIDTQLAALDSLYRADLADLNRQLAQTLTPIEAPPPAVSGAVASGDNG